MVLSNSFWPGMCAFLGVFFAMLVVVEFSAYVGMRYRERFLSEASIELDDVLIQMPAGRVLRRMPVRSRRTAMTTAW